MIYRLAIACLAFALPAPIALGHEFWIEPAEFQVETGAELTAELRNGENLDGIALAYFDRRFDRFDWRLGDGVTPVEGRNGDRPALAMTAPATDGLMAITYVSGQSTVTYTEWEKFARFARHKALGDVAARHDARALPRDRVREVYTRFAKALVAVGGGAGADAPTGMETEIVALENPYMRDGSGPLPVQVLYQGAPRAAAQVEIFARGPGGAVTVTQVTTDNAGVAQVPVTPGHDYLLDAVVLREPSQAQAEKHEVDWETLWAALTFRVPDS